MVKANHKGSEMSNNDVNDTAGVPQDDETELAFREDALSEEDALASVDDPALSPAEAMGLTDTKSKE